MEELRRLDPDSFYGEIISTALGDFFAQLPKE